MSSRERRRRPRPFGEARRLLVVAAFALPACGEEPHAAPRGEAGAPPAPDPLDWCIGRVDHRPIKITGGDQTLAVLFDDGTVYCWGDHYTSQCDATMFQLVLSTPIQIPTLPCLQDVAISSVGLGVLSDGRAVQWGGTPTEGPGSRAAPTTVRVIDVPAPVTAVYSGGMLLGAVADGDAYSWTPTDPGSAPRPTQVVLDGPAEGMAGTPGASCYRFGGGALACLGRNVGLWGPTIESSSVPVPIDIGGMALDHFIHGASACALRVDGEVLCWGDNSLGSLGRGIDSTELASDPTPQVILEPGPFVGLSSGGPGGCAWRASGEVVCWGISSPFPYEGAEAFSWPPRRIPHLEPARQVAATYDRLCALGFDDQVRCDVRFVGEPPSAEVMVFAPPFGTKEHPDAARR